MFRHLNVRSGLARSPQIPAIPDTSDGLEGSRYLGGGTHDLTGLRNVAEFFRQVEKTDFVFDDLFTTLKHMGYLSLGFDGWVRAAIKTGNPRPFQGTGVRSDLNYFT